MTGHGLNDDGSIAREGALDRVPAPFAPLVEAARVRLATVFTGRRMHSAYLYGSIPRGTAIAGVSDLDLLVALRAAPAAADRADAAAVEKELAGSFGQISGVGLLLYPAATLLSELERHDLGFFVACLCTPLIGPDLGAALPRYWPTALLARETNGDLALALPDWRARMSLAHTDTERARLTRGVARRLVRSGFTLVMPQWGGWTSDLEVAAEAFGRYYPGERAAQMRAAAAAARSPADHTAALDLLVSDLAPWLAAEYTAVHGPKAPRPADTGP
jgi:predicted nucleotidyltransferase